MNRTKIFHDFGKNLKNSEIQQFVVIIPRFEQYGCTILEAMHPKDTAKIDHIWSRQTYLDRPMTLFLTNLSVYSSDGENEEERNFIDQGSIEEKERAGAPHKINNNTINNNNNISSSSSNSISTTATNKNNNNNSLKDGELLINKGKYKKIILIGDNTLPTMMIMIMMMIHKMHYGKLPCN